MAASPRSSEVVGIDFGTSYTSVSAAIGDEVYVLGDEQGRALHPSVVHYGEDGLPECGWSARERILTSPRRTISSPKRLLGRAYEDRHSGPLLHAMANETARAEDGSVVVVVDGQRYAIIQNCAAIMAHVRDLAERVLSRPVTRAVFSVPVTFAAEQRSALERAAKIAGLEVVALIEEPVAAAMAYGFGLHKNEIVAVYDFGGGTFDFTVLDISGYSFEILARGGDSWLGGDDFDLATANVVANAFWRATEVELRDRAVEWRRLLFACEAAKRELSVSDSAMISVERLLEYPKVVNLRQTLSRAKFEEICEEFRDRSLTICADALSRAGLEPEDIGQVVVSGGVSHIPFVLAGVESFFRRTVHPLVDPDLAICLGAGLRAAQLSQYPVSGTAGVFGVA